MREKNDSMFKSVERISQEIQRSSKSGSIRSFTGCSKWLVPFYNKNKKLANILVWGVAPHGFGRHTLYSARLALLPETSIRP